MSSKAQLLETVRSELKRQFERLAASADEARSAATDPDSKAESKYDTRSLEASYLAAGQARQVEELAAALQRLESLEPHDFDLTDPVGPGALVELETGEETQYYLLVPAGGGVSIVHDGREITLLTPDSALYQALLGKAVGDALESPDGFVSEVA